MKHLVKVTICLSIVVNILSFSNAHADDDREGSYFIWPNEMRPQKMRSITSKVQPGIIASVGTERGFILGALAANATKDDPQNILYLIDYNHENNRINEYNAALLDLSLKGDLADYKHLRLKATFEEIELLLKKRPTSRKTQNILSRRENFEHWTKVRDIDENFVWEKFYDPPINSFGPRRRYRAKQFTESVYLHNKELFASIQKLAKEGKIIVQNINLADAGEVREWTDAIRERKTPLSIVDVSNVWHRRYMKPKQFVQLIDSLNQVANDDSILQIANQVSIIGIFTVLDIGSGDSMAPWNYSGYTFGHIRIWPSTKLFDASLRYLFQASKPVNGLRHHKGPCSTLLIRLIEN